MGMVSIQDVIWLWSIHMLAFNKEAHTAPSYFSLLCVSLHCKVLYGSVYSHLSDPLTDITTAI